MNSLPAHFFTTRLTIRPWTDADRPAFEQAVAESFDHLRPWLPWARHPREEVWQVLQAFLQKPESANDMVYAIFDHDESRVLGGIGVHHRGEESEREIGYWLHRNATGLGYMTEAVAAMTDAVFAALPVAQVIIFCDPANVRSAAVPRRLGYDLTGIFPAKFPAPDRTEDMIWRVTREAWQALSSTRGA